MQALGHGLALVVVAYGDHKMMQHMKFIKMGKIFYAAEDRWAMDPAAGGLKKINQSYGLITAVALQQPVG